MSKKIYDLCVVGGGAAGLCGGISAKRQGADVLILERNDRVGKKILATGNGRCNITNSCIFPENYHGGTEFAMEVLKRVSREKALGFLESMGVLCIEEDNGRMYPKSLQATSVLDLLREEIALLQIEVKTSCFVKNIKKEKGIFCIENAEESVFAKSVLLCTGGYAAPAFGSDGNGAALAKRLGHSESAVHPALVQLKTENVPKALKGVKHICTAHLYIEGKRIKSSHGEVLFTEYGLSGPPIFNLSRAASEAVAGGKECYVSLELMEEDFRTLSEFLQKRKKSLPHLGRENFLNSVINKKIGFEITKKCENIKEMTSMLKDWRHHVLGTMGFKNAQVTAGGIRCSEVSFDNMMSKKTAGLYLAGEILDVDGDCGGYNLQFAISSGILAGESAARSKS